MKLLVSSQEDGEGQRRNLWILFEEYFELNSNSNFKFLDNCIDFGNLISSGRNKFKLRKVAIRQSNGDNRDSGKRKHLIRHK